MWKTKCGRCIYTSLSGYKVYQNIFYRWLTLGSSALQTVINRRRPYVPILHYLPILSMMVRIVPGDCCLLGLGGAGIAHMLSSLCSITAVESSDEVIKIAQQFFMTDEIPHLTVVHQNALTFLHESKRTYPHILVDLYDANHFPAECSTDNFFVACRNVLSDDGFIAFNLANLSEQRVLFQLIQKQFKSTVVIPIKQCANVVIIATKNEDKGFLINRVELSLEIKKISWVSGWGFVAQY